MGHIQKEFLLHLRWKTARTRFEHINGTLLSTSPSSSCALYPIFCHGRRVHVAVSKELHHAEVQDLCDSILHGSSSYSSGFAATLPLMVSRGLNPNQARDANECKHVLYNSRFVNGSKLHNKIDKNYKNNPNHTSTGRRKHDYFTFEIVSLTACRRATTFTTPTG